MKYKRVELNVVEEGIHECKIFQGLKIFSRSKLSEDQKSILLFENQIQTTSASPCRT